MKKLFFLLIVSMAVIACNNNSKDEKAGSPETGDSKEKSESKSSPAVEGGRYGIKSAKVVMVTALPGGMGSTVVTQYFDNYGKDSYTETTTEINIKGVPAQPKQISISQGEYIYSWTEGSKTGTRVKLGSGNDLKDVDLEKMGKEMSEKLKVKKTGNETHLGKDCDVYEMDNSQIGKGKILTWKNIPMRTDMTVMGKTMRTEVRELEENPSLDASKFKIPADVEFKDISVSM